MASLTHFDFPDQEFLQQMEACRFDVALFPHEAHLRLAWLYLHDFDRIAAAERLCTTILRFASAAGAPGKFNRTVTVAATFVVAHFMDRTPGVSFKSLLQSHPRLKTNFKDLLEQHYSYDIFMNERAKKEYLEPDLAVFY